MPLPATSAETQILAAYEQGLSPEEIAAELNYNLVAVKSSLLRNSPAYYQLSKVEAAKPLSEQSKPLFTEDQKRVAAQNIERLQMSEVDAVALRSSIFVLTADKQGQNEAELLKKVQAPFVQFNDMMRKALEARERLLKSANINQESITV